jgi:alpha-amylase
MTNVCVYFQLHQPRRLRRLSPLRPNGDLSYFDDEQNAAIVRRVAERCYLPALSAIAAAVKESAGDFRCVMSITGELIEQLRDWSF